MEYKRKSQPFIQNVFHDMNFLFYIRSLLSSCHNNEMKNLFNVASYHASMVHRVHFDRKLSVKINSYAASQFLCITDTVYH